MTKSIVIYGPPGTGKTRRLMGIMAQLKDERKVPASAIGFFAFTRAAADEAKKRLGVTSSKTMRTLHSLAFEAAGISKVQVVDTEKLQKFAQLVKMPINGKAVNGFENVEIGDEYKAIHDFAIARQISIDAAFDVINPSLDRAVARMFSKAYVDWKRSYGWKDFNDMVLDYIANPIDIGAKYLFIDEAQDLSPMQWRMVERLIEHAECVWLAGDDDQSIYEWSGADPHGMSAYHAEGNQRVLEKSYRVPRKVHRLAESVIKRVTRRVEKAYAPRDEDGSLNRFGSFAALPPPKEDTLVLYRNHSGRREAEAWLMEHAVPYAAVGPFPSIFHGRFANAARAWFRAAAGDQLTDFQAEQIKKVAPHLAPALLAKDYKFTKDRPSRHFVGLSPEVENYLKRVDLHAVPQVRISTIHAAKGAEADRVVLLNGMGERTFEAMRDDEHRVWYVGVTRARHRLDIVDGDNAYPL